MNNRVVVDYELSRIRYKDDPSHTWHDLPTTQNGLMLLPLTREASRRLAADPYVPVGVPKRGKQAYSVEEKEEEPPVDADTL